MTTGTPRRGWRAGAAARRRPPAPAWTTSARSGAARLLALALPAALLAAGGAFPRGAAAAPGRTPGHAAAGVLSRATLEEQHGIRITRIAVTGGGGLVDLRFTVIDPQKARRLLDGAHAPSLIAGKKGQPLTAPHHGAMRSIRIQRDAACYVLFPNARNAVKRGTRVQVAFGDLRVEPMAAL